MRYVSAVAAKLPLLDSQRLFILSVAPEEKTHQLIREAVDPAIPIRAVHTADEALHDDRAHRWLGIIVGNGFGDAEGLSLAQQLVERAITDVAVAWVAEEPTMTQLRIAGQYAITMSVAPISSATLTAFGEQCHLRRLPRPPMAREFAARQIAADHGLTARETEVLRSLLEGADATLIAQRFQIADKTAQHHISSILRKTGAVRSRQLMVKALHHAQQAGADGMPLADLTPRPIDPAEVHAEIARLEAQRKAKDESGG